MLARNLRSFIHLKKRQNAASLLHYIFNEKPSKCAKSPAYHKRKFRLFRDNVYVMTTSDCCTTVTTAVN